MSTTPRDSERRYATVMFADISGFTAMSRSMDPEDVTQLMNRCFQLLEEVVTGYGGHVDKYIGDCIMALFGVPTGLEEAPRQAVNAAIEIRNRLARFNEDARLPVPLKIRVGINTGLVLAGDVGGPAKHDFTVMGQTVNLAARLKDAAGLRAIWVGPQTYNDTRDDFEYRRLEPLELKGMGSVPAYEVVSSRQQRHRARLRSKRQLFSTMVGRDRELAKLVQCFADLARGRGSVVSVVGDAGIGKSRLIAEALATPEAGAVRVVEARSIALGENLSYHPFVDLLRQWARIADDDGEGPAFEKLAAAVHELLGTAADDVLPFVATLAGIRLPEAAAERIGGIDADVLEKLIHKGMRDVLQALAKRRPLVLFFEDVHWADLSSVTLLISLLALARDTPIVFLLALRPDPLRPSHGVLRVLGTRFPAEHHEIRLGPLDSTQSALLLRHAITTDDRPHSTRAAILPKTEGNPFFMEEVIRSLVEEGVVEESEDGLRVTAKIESVVVPGTVHEVIMARIDRMPQSVRRVLQVASVIGRSFTYRVLAAVTPPEQLEWALAHLTRAQLLEKRSGDDDLGYAFKHALTQETIYESILRRTRLELHRAVAEAIESLYAERLADFFGMLAYHFSRAESTEKAGEYLVKAGDEAARAAASSEALTYFREAARLYLAAHGEGGDPETKARLEKKIGLAFINKGDLPQALDHFDRALAHLGNREPRSAFGEALRLGSDLGAILAHLYLSGRVRRRRPPGPRDLEEVEIRFHKAMAQSTSAPRGYFTSTLRGIRLLNGIDPTAVDQACGMYAAAAALFAYSGVSFRVSRRFLPIANRLVRNVRDEIGYRTMEFLHHYLVGSWENAREIEEDRLEEGLRSGAPVWQISTYLGLECERKIHQGRLTAADALIERLARIGDDYGYDFVRTSQYFMTTLMLLQERRLASALEASERYFAVRHEETLNLLALGVRAKILALMGDLHAARQASAGAEDIVHRLGREVAPYHLGTHVLSRLLLDVQDLELSVAAGSRPDVARAERAARASARRAVRVAARIARDRPEVYRHAGRMFWAIGDHRRALATWRRAIAEAEHLDARPELARIYMDIGERLGESGSAVTVLDGVGAAGYLDRARTTLGQLGNFVRDLETLESIAERAA